MKSVRMRWQRMSFVIASFLVVLTLVLYIFAPPSVLMRHFKCDTKYLDSPLIQRAMETCNLRLLNGAMGGKEGDVPTDKYQLVSLHVILRHGDRTALVTLPNTERVSKVSCRIDQRIFEHLPFMMDYLAVMRRETGARGPKQTFFGHELFPNRDRCRPGDVTPEGVAQHVQSGRFLAGKYLDRWNLFDATSSISEQLRWRSTDMGRTYQSGVAFLYGMLPELRLAQHNIEIATSSSMCTASSQVKCKCHAVKNFHNLFSPSFGNDRKSFQAQPEYKEYFEEMQQILGVPYSEFNPFPYKHKDVLMARVCHGLPLPGNTLTRRCVEPPLLVRLQKMLHANAMRNARDGEAFMRVARIRMHPLFIDMATRMRDQLVGENKQKLLMYSAHDTTVDPMLTAMGMATGWPPFASRIVFELYNKKAETSAHATQSFIRVLFNGEVVTSQLRFCRNKTDSRYGMCSFSHFYDFATKNNLQDLGYKSYDEACAQDIDYGKDS